MQTPYNLGARGRRVLEDACAEKWRLDPLRSERRDFSKLDDRNGRGHERRMRGMSIVARGNKRRCASVIRAIGI